MTAARSEVATRPQRCSHKEIGVACRVIYKVYGVVCGLWRVSHPTAMGAHNGGLRTAIYTTRLHHTRARARYLSRLTTPKALWLSGGDDARTSAAHSDSHCGPARCRVGATHPVPRSAPTQERSALSAASTALRMPRMARPPSSDISYIRFTHYTELSANRIGIHTPRVSRAREPRCTTLSRAPAASRVRAQCTFAHARCSGGRHPARPPCAAWTRTPPTLPLSFACGCAHTVGGRLLI